MCRCRCVEKNTDDDNDSFHDNFDQNFGILIIMITKMTEKPTTIVNFRTNILLRRGGIWNLAQTPWKIFRGV